MRWPKFTSPAGTTQRALGLLTQFQGVCCAVRVNTFNNEKTWASIFPPPPHRAAALSCLKDQGPFLWGPESATGAPDTLVAVASMEWMPVPCLMSAMGRGQALGLPLTPCSQALPCPMVSAPTL